MSLDEDRKQNLLTDIEWIAADCAKEHAEIFYDQGPNKTSRLTPRFAKALTYAAVASAKENQMSLSALDAFFRACVQDFYGEECPHDP